MKCITCGDECSRTYCDDHNDNEVRLERLSGIVNARQYSGFHSAERALSYDRRPSTLRSVVDWMIKSGYYKWYETVLPYDTILSLTVTAGIHKIKNLDCIIFEVSGLPSTIGRLISNLGCRRSDSEGHSRPDTTMVSVPWNKWVHFRHLLSEYYPIRKYSEEVKNWKPQKTPDSSCPRTMRLVHEGLYTSQVAVNRGQLVSGEYVATKSGVSKFVNIFKGAHQISNKPIGNFGLRFKAPGTIENLEALLEFCEQPLDIKLEACSRIYELISRQEAIASTFSQRMCTTRYNEDKLHKYIYNEVEDPFNSFMTTKSPDLTLEQWKEYLNLMEPYSQQKIMCEASLKAKYVAWWVDMRVGKTPAGMMMMRKTIKDSDVDHWLVVAPAVNLYDPWFSELERQGCFRVCVLDEGSKIDEENIASEEFDVYLISYSSLAARLPIMQHYWSMESVGVMADETSLAKNPSSKRAKALGHLTAHSPYVFALNGTPLAQGPQDIWAQQYFIDQGVTFGTHFNRFLEYWLKKVGPNKYALDSDVSTLFELRLSGSSIRYIRSEADQFSGKDKNFRYIVMPPSKEIKKGTAEILNGYTRDEFMDERTIKDNILTIYGHLRECCGGYNKYEIVDGAGEYKRVRHNFNPKVVWIKAFLKANPGQPMVIFSENTELENMIMEMLLKEKISFASVRDMYGKKLTGEARMDQIHSFQNGDVRVFLMKSRQGKGITLNRIPAVKAGKGSYPVIVYTQPTWSLIDWEQSQDRSVGVDPKTKKSIGTMIYVLAIKGSIEWEIIKALRRKKNVATELLADAARNGFINPFDEMDLSGDSDDADEIFDAEDMEARIMLGLAPQKKLSERMIHKADVRYRAKKYGTTQKVQESRPMSSAAAYLVKKYDTKLPYENLDEYREKKNVNG